MLVCAFTLGSSTVSTNTFELGVVFPHNEIGSDPADIRAFAQGAESLGATHLLIYDHVLGADPNRPGGWRGVYDKDTQFHEPLTTLAYLAGVTDKIELVTNILILPQRQTALVAKQAAQVAILSNNRLRLGVGTGWNKIEYEALGVPFERRGTRQTEQVELLKSLWSEDSLDYTGEFHRVNQASINPRPSETIPVWFGGAAPVLLKRAARLGDGWMPLEGPNDRTRAALETLRSLLPEQGKDPATFGVQGQLQWARGNPEKWQRARDSWNELGASHLAIATHQAEPTDCAGHLARLEEVYATVRS